MESNPSAKPQVRRRVVEWHNVVLIDPVMVETSLTHGLLPQPVPLNTSPGAEYKRLISNLHFGHCIVGTSSLNEL